MRLTSRALILGITSTQETRSEEDGVENRSEPQGWPADGSPGSTDPAQDADQAAGGTTALSTAQAQDAGVPDAAAGAAEQAGPATGSPGYATGSADFTSSPDFGGSDLSHGGSSYGNGNGASPSGTVVPPGWGSAATEPAATASGADGAGGFSGPAAGSGAPTLATPYATPEAGRAQQQADPFPAPGQVRPQPPRPGPAPRPQAGPRPGRGAPAGPSASSRKAQLAVARIEPWSVMKFSFMISLVGWVILFVAVAIIFFVLSKLGVFHSIENTVGLVTASKQHAGANAASWFSASRVLGYTMLVGAVNVILITALATVGAVLYNLVTMLAGGIEVTLKETD
jgi:hypothetical protein